MFLSAVPELQQVNPGLPGREMLRKQISWNGRLCAAPKYLGRFKMCKRSVKRDCSLINTCLAGKDSELEMGISGRNQEFLINEYLLGRKNLLWPQLQCRQEATNEKAQREPPHGNDVLSDAWWGVLTLKAPWMCTESKGSVSLNIKHTKRGDSLK